MSVSFEVIAERISHYSLELHIFNKDYSFVNDVVLFDYCKNQLKRELLYICKATDLPEITSFQDCLNIICIRDNRDDIDFLESNHHNFLFVNPPADINRLFNEVNHFITEQHKLNRGLQKLSEALLSCKGIQHLVDIATEVFENPVTVCDMSFKFLGLSKEKVDPLWCHMAEIGYCNYDHVQDMKDSGFLEVYKSDTPIIFKKKGMMIWNYMALRFTINNKVVGHVSVLEKRNPFNENTAILLKHFSKIVSCEMQRNSYLNNTKGMLYEFFLIDLLEGKIRDRMVIEERMKSLGLSLNKDLYLLSLRPKSEVLGNIALAFITDWLERIFVKSKCIVYKNNIILLLSYPKDKFLTESELSKLIDFLNEHQLIAGISYCFHDIANISEAYEQSTIAMNMGIRLHKEKKFHFYQDYILYHLLNLAGENKDLKSFYNPLIIKLMEYDEEYQTKYAQTLYTYLSNGNNLAKSARIFNIQPNSMSYRIKRIEKLLNIDLNDPDVSFCLYLSFKIFLFTNKTLLV